MRMRTVCAALGKQQPGSSTSPASTDVWGGGHLCMLRARVCAALGKYASEWAVCGWWLCACERFVGGCVGRRIHPNAQWNVCVCMRVLRMPGLEERPESSGPVAF